MLTRRKKWLRIAGGLLLIIAAGGLFLTKGRDPAPNERPLLERVDDAWHAKTWRDSWDMLTGQYYYDIVSPNFVSLIPDDGKLHWSLLVSDLKAKIAADAKRGEYVKGK